MPPIGAVQVPGFPGYHVERNGTVWSRWRIGKGRKSFISDRWKRLKTAERRDGYVMAILSKDGRAHARYVHRLVIEAFVGPCPEGMESLHDDGDRSNNHLGNLRWGTRRENSSDKVRHGTSNEGERHSLARLTNEDVVKVMEMLDQGLGCKDIAAVFKVNRGTIWWIANGKHWTHITGGRVWR